MARGWESKSIEGQQQDAARGRPSHDATSLTPDEQVREQRRASLQLARARTEADLARASGRYAEMLTRQLAAIDQQLAALATDQR